jgi:hypothetical protein
LNAEFMRVVTIVRTGEFSGEGYLIGQPLRLASAPRERRIAGGKSRDGRAEEAA